MKIKPTILVCPLNWGIGHATRCVPIIKELLLKDVNVIIAADNRPLSFLRQEFPDLQFIQYPGYHFSYPEKGSMVMKMLFQAPGIIKDIKKEQIQLEQIVKDCKIDAVISDNRFGAYSKSIPSVFITHQTMIKTPLYLKFIEPLLFAINKSYISKFSECWIPDYESDNNLSGELSHRYKLPGEFKFIGPLSRFYDGQTEKIPENELTYDFLVMLSGPEPQRSMLEKALISQLKVLDFKGVVLGGKPDQKEQVDLSDQIKFYSHLETNSLNSLIQNSKVIISRPGYSTIMDLSVFGKKAIFIPTPGQTEQEYLADYFQRNNRCIILNQKEFDIGKAMNEAHNCKAIKIKFENDLLKAGIENLLSRL